MLNISPTKRASRLSFGIFALSLTLPPLLATALQRTDPLPDSKWKLIVPNWNLGEHARLSAPTLRFEGGRAIASAGCNTMSGTYTIKGETMKVGALLSTKMACGEPLDTTERRYSTALGSTTKWQLSRDGKILLIQNGKEPLVFERQLEAKKSPGKVELP